MTLAQAKLYLAQRKGVRTVQQMGKYILDPRQPKAKWGQPGLPVPNMRGR